MPENEMGIIESEDMLIHNIITPELKEKDKQIDQLTNNWNELEEWLFRFNEEHKNDTALYSNWLKPKEILNKMKEIKGEK